MSARAAATPARFMRAHASRSSGSTSSASPMRKASKNGATGSGCVATGPPPRTSGASSPRSTARSGMPPRSSSVSTLVYVISYCSEMPTTSKSAERARALERDERQVARAQLALHVDPRRERALAQDARLLVQERIEDLRPEVRHPDVVDVGERQRDAHVDGRPVLDDRLVLAAEIPRRLLDVADEGRIRMLHRRRRVTLEAFTCQGVARPLP